MSSKVLGAKVKPSAAREIISHVFKTNMRWVKEGKIENKTALALWGSAGVGKTTMIRQLEKDGIEIDGKMIYPKVVLHALAQSEEMGDITGLPDKDSQEKVTKFLVPSWFPTKEKYGDQPGILVIDDGTRGDPRLLQGMMQFIQDHKMNHVELPPNWTIMWTGNPPSDGVTEYMVNTVDKATLTRMLHLYIEFDKVDWAFWAEKNNIDKRVISWGLMYHEMIDGLHGERTNPRAVENFSRQICFIDDLKANQNLVMSLANAAVDEEAASCFWKFAIGDLNKLVEPDEILNDWENAEKKLDNLKKEGKSEKLRTDLVGIIVDRLYVHIMNDRFKFSTKSSKNFGKFLLRKDLLPHDMMFLLMSRLWRESSEEKKEEIRKITRGGDAKFLEQMIKEMEKVS